MSRSLQEWDAILEGLDESLEILVTKLKGFRSPSDQTETPNKPQPKEPPQSLDSDSDDDKEKFSDHSLNDIRDSDYSTAKDKVSIAKDFYRETSKTANRPKDEVISWRKSNGIMIEDQDCQIKPILEFDELDVPDAVTEMCVKFLKKQRRDTPTSFQAQSWPIALRGKDVMAMTKSNSGKILGLLLPMMVHVMEQSPSSEGEGPVAVVLTPNRHSVQKLDMRVKQFCETTLIRSTAVYAGPLEKCQNKTLQSGTEIIIACPDQLLKCIESGMTNMGRVSFLIIDEADEMRKNWEAFIREICGLMRKERQTLMHSATWSEEVKRLADDLQNEAVEIRINDAERGVEVLERSSQESTAEVTETEIAWKYLKRQKRLFRHKISLIKESNPENIMANCWKDDYFESLEFSDQVGLLKICEPGAVEYYATNPGCYAMNHTDYDRFAEFFRPIIEKYHKVDLNITTHKEDWDLPILDLSSLGEKIQAIMVTSFSRNLNYFPLQGNMDKEDRISMELALKPAFDKMIANPDFGGKYVSSTPGHPDEVSNPRYRDKALMVYGEGTDRKLADREHLNSAGITSDWPHGRGTYISEDENLIIVVGEEDHIRFITWKIQTTIDFNRLKTAIDNVEDLVPGGWARSQNFGIVTNTPTNIGTGMQVVKVRVYGKKIPGEGIEVVAEYKFGMTMKDVAESLYSSAKAKIRAVTEDDNHTGTALAEDKNPSVDSNYINNNISDIGNWDKPEEQGDLEEVEKQTPEETKNPENIENADPENENAEEKEPEPVEFTLEEYLAGLDQGTKVEKKNVRQANDGKEIKGKTLKDRRQVFISFTELFL